MKKTIEIKVPINRWISLEHHIKEKLSTGKIPSYRIIRKSIDARKRLKVPVIFYKLEINPKAKRLLPYFKNIPKINPTIVGMGPCGIFAALFLNEFGINGTIIEQGCPVEERVKKVNDLWDKGRLDTTCNVCFGEGGAGTFSDGKLTTRVKHPYIEWILTKLVEFGAPEEILYEAKPHLGTDNIRNIVVRIRKFLIRCGWNIKFNHKLTDIVLDSNRKLRAIIVNNNKEIKTEDLILAIGNSARKTYSMLIKRGVHLINKPFALGFRVEHPQELINEIQYGKWKDHPLLPVATYNLSYYRKDLKRGVYTFCMCPGGYVICSSTKRQMLVTNGMSYSKRDSIWANAAVVVTVDERDYGNGLMGAVEFQERLEKRAYNMGKGNFTAPAQRLTDFISNKESFSLPKSSYKPALIPTKLNGFLPSHLEDVIKEAIISFDKKMKGFLTKEAIIIAVETRTSSPIRIARKDNMQSVNTYGLYPAGEGSGYAGGIISSALDGIKAAEAMIRCHL